MLFFLASTAGDRVHDYDGKEEERVDELRSKQHPCCLRQRREPTIRQSECIGDAQIDRVGGINQVVRPGDLSHVLVLVEVRVAGDVERERQKKVHVPTPLTIDIIAQGKTVSPDVMVEVCEQVGCDQIPNQQLCPEARPTAPDGDNDNQPLGDQKAINGDILCNFGFV